MFKPFLLSLTLVVAASLGSLTPARAQTREGGDDAALVQAQIEAARAAAKAIVELAAQPVPPGATTDEDYLWHAQSLWLLTVAGELAHIAAQPTDMTTMNMAFMKLQEATQTESRKFQTLSNASRRSSSAIDKIKALVVPRSHAQATASRGLHGAQSE